MNRVNFQKKQGDELNKLLEKQKKYRDLDDTIKKLNERNKQSKKYNLNKLLKEQEQNELSES